MGTEGWGLVIIGVIEVVPAMIEFGFAVQRRSQPEQTNGIGVPAELSLDRPKLIWSKEL